MTEQEKDMSEKRDQDQEKPSEDQLPTTAVPAPVPTPGTQYAAVAMRAEESVEMARQRNEQLGQPSDPQQQQSDQRRSDQKVDPYHNLKNHLDSAFGFPANLRDAFHQWVDSVEGHRSGGSQRDEQSRGQQGSPDDASLSSRMDDVGRRMDDLERRFSMLHEALSAPPAPPGVQRAVSDIPSGPDAVPGSGGEHQHDAEDESDKPADDK